MQFYLEVDTVTRRAREIATLLLDVDGIFTGGELTYTSEGGEIKTFNILDGLGIKLLQRSGIEVAILSGRRSPMLERRAAELDIRHIVQGREDKLEALRQLCLETGFEASRMAYAGDDLPDIAVLKQVALALTVPNAHASVKKVAHACTDQPGGQGAIREIADFLLQAQDKYDSSIAPYF